MKSDRHFDPEVIEVNGGWVTVLARMLGSAAGRAAAIDRQGAERVGDSPFLSGGCSASEGADPAVDAAVPLGRAILL